MAAEEDKKTNDTPGSTDFKSVPMGQMMSQMMKMCRTEESGFPDCAAMMKGIMKPPTNQSPHPPHEPNGEPEEKKK